MNITTTIRADQLVPISKARANLSTLVENVGDKGFFVLVRKYQPKAALIDLKFLEKLLTAYHHWCREQDFASLDKLRKSIPVYKSSEVEKDIKDAIRAVRKTS